MKSSLVFTALLAGVSAGIFERANKVGCKSDNCARAITGGNAAASSSKVSKDCVSYQTSTLCPTSTSTTTIFTSGTESNTTPGPSITCPAGTPSPLPTYASACSTDDIRSRFASACSCAGVTASSTYLQPVPTATIMVPFQAYTDCKAVVAAGGYTSIPTNKKYDAQCGSTFVTGTAANPNAYVFFTSIQYQFTDCFDSCSNYRPGPSDPACVAVNYISEGRKCQLLSSTAGGSTSALGSGGNSGTRRA